MVMIKAGAQSPGFFYAVNKNTLIAPYRNDFTVSITATS